MCSGCRTPIKVMRHGSVESLAGSQMPLSPEKRRLFILRSPGEVAAFFGVTEAAVRTRWIPAGMPKFEPTKAIKLGESQFRFRADDIVVWLITEGPWRKRVDPSTLEAAAPVEPVEDVAPPPPVNADPDAMMTAPVTTPSMERYRAAKATLAEMEVEERRRQLIRRESVTMALVAFMGWLFKQVKRFDMMSVVTGREAAVELREAIASAIEVVKGRLEEHAGFKLDMRIGSDGLEPAGSVPPGDLPDVAPTGPSDQPMGGRGNHDPNGPVCGEPVPPLASSGEPDMVSSTGA